MYDPEFSNRRPVTVTGPMVSSFVTVANCLVPFGAGVWLAYNGYTEEAAIGVGLAIAMPLVWVLLAHGPSEAIKAPAQRSADGTEAATGFLLGFLGACWQYGALAAWTMFVLFYLVAPCDPAVETQVLLWGYGTIMAPIALMTGARATGRGNGSMLAIGLFIYMAAAFLYTLDSPAVMMATWLGAAALIGALIDLGVGGAAASTQRRAAHQHHVIADNDTLGRDLHFALAVHNDFDNDDNLS